MEMTNFDFLRLMWEAQPSAIVMLCQLEEEGKVRKEDGEVGRGGEERRGRRGVGIGRGGGKGGRGGLVKDRMVRKGHEGNEQEE